MKTALENHNLWSHVFFSVDFDGESLGSKSDWEDGQENSEEMARANICGVSGATSSLCKVVRVIRYVHAYINQPESVLGDLPK